MVLLETARKKLPKEFHTVLWINLLPDLGKSQLQNKRQIRKLKRLKQMVKRELKLQKVQLQKQVLLKHQVETMIFKILISKLLSNHLQLKPQLREKVAMLNLVPQHQVLAA